MNGQQKGYWRGKYLFFFFLVFSFHYLKVKRCGISHSIFKNVVGWNTNLLLLFTRTLFLCPHFLAAIASCFYFLHLKLFSYASLLCSYTHKINYCGSIYCHEKKERKIIIDFYRLCGYRMSMILRKFNYYLILIEVLESTISSA